MAKSVVTVPSRSYNPGTRTASIPNLSTDDNGIQIILTRESWPVGTDILSGSIDGSNDGTTWFNLTVFSYDGGDQINPRTGQLVTTCGPTVYWPERNDGSGNAVPQRPQSVRGTVTNTARLTTAITLQGV